MEAAMYKCLASVAGTVAIVSAALLTPAQAGGAASAASKYGHSSQVATYQASTNRRAKPNDFPITEYSSSSARTHGAKYR
jgi:hypothetical protein